MGEVTMPRLSDTMSEGAVGRWLKQPGDAVESGEIIAEIETDKATMELEAFESGTLQKIVIGEGETVPIGEVIAYIGDGPAEEGADDDDDGGGTATAEADDDDDEATTGETDDSDEDEAETDGKQKVDNPPTESYNAGPQAPDEEGEAIAEATDEDTEESPRSTARDNGKADSNGRVKASPVARRIAEEAGINLAEVEGTGPGGRILKDNVEEYRQKLESGEAKPAKQEKAAPAKQEKAAPAKQEKAAPAPAAQAASGDVEPMGRMRRAIAKAMNTSKPGVPHIYVSMEIDMAEAMKLRKQINDSGASESKISVNDLVVKAAARAITKFPGFNSSYATTDDDKPGVVQHPNINIGVAVSIDEGLVAPVVRDADKKSIGTISAEIKDMAKRAREGKIKPNELDGGTFQVSNLGMFEVMEFVSIISVPQSGSLSVGAVRQVPVVRDGEIVVGQMMTVTISADHRVVDGAIAAQYLQEVKRLLEAPMSLLV